MKENRGLEEKFDEYFGGVTLPKETTAEAKAYMERKKRARRVRLRAVSAAACFALVGTVALGIFYFGESAQLRGGPYDIADSTPPPADMPNGSDWEEDAVSPDSAGSDGEDGGASGGVSSEGNGFAGGTYRADELEGRRLSLESAAALCPEAAVLYGLADSAVLYTLDGNVALLTAECADATVYLEYTAKTYEPLAAYRNGEEKTYGGVSYLLTQTETHSLIFAARGNVKYYFAVNGLEESCYAAYLRLLAD